MPKNKQCMKCLKKSIIHTSPSAQIPSAAWITLFFHLLCFLTSLIKEYRQRPKYKKLLEYPFIKKYEQKKVDVAAWFAG